MKSYDEISYYGKNWGLPVIAFDKLDGSNLRFEYSKKRGFYKFGTRNMIIDRNHEQFGFAVDLFMEKYSESLTKIFNTSKQYRNALSFVCFAEVYGEKSEFGWHDYGNDKFDVTLFDVNVYKKGLVEPKQFVDDFGHTGIPNIIYQGNLNMDLVNQIKQNEFGLREGVICKGKIPNVKEPHSLFYCKIKTNDWFERLRNKEPKLYMDELKQSHELYNEK